MPPSPAFEPYVLTPFDHSMISIHLPCLMTFYPDDLSSAVAVLETGVQRLVELLPFLSGNVTSSSRVIGKENAMEVQPPTAEFLQKHPMLKVKTHQKYANPMNRKHIHDDLRSNEDLLPVAFEMGAEEFSPIFRLQINAMIDAIIVSTSFNHMALDGIGVVNTLKALSVCCRNPDASPDDLPTTPQQEEKSRQEIFKAASAPNISDQLRADYGAFDWIPMYDEISERPISRNLVLDATKIETLKTACTNLLRRRSLGPVARLSSNTIASAVVWLCLIRARYGYNAMQGEEMPLKSCMLVAVNARPKLEKILSASYMGNGLITVESYTPIQQIISSFNQSRSSSNRPKNVDPEDIHHLTEVALSLHDSLQSVTTDYVRGVISNVFKKNDWASSPRPGDFVLSSLRSFKLYELDFGPLLGPVKDIDISQNRIPGISWLKPSGVEGRMAPWEVRIALDAATMERMESDGLMKWLSPAAPSARL
jgi:hypothetical protein